MHKRNSGLELVEVMVLVAIIGLLCTMLLPALNHVRQKNRQAADPAYQKAQREIEVAELNRQRIAMQEKQRQEQFALEEQQARDRQRQARRERDQARKQALAELSAKQESARPRLELMSKSLDNSIEVYYDWERRVYVYRDVVHGGLTTFVGEAPKPLPVALPLEEAK